MSDGLPPGSAVGAIEVAPTAHADDAGHNVTIGPQGMDQISQHRLAGDGTYDYIVIGTGSAGASLARDLSASGQRVLMLERGEHKPLKETVWALASMLNEIKVGHKLKDPRVFAAGGSSAMYLAMAETPPLEVFRAAGIDMADDFACARGELPLGELPDELLSPQTLHLRDAALAEGLPWKKNLMLIDTELARDGYAYAAKWKALDYVGQALAKGAVLQCETEVQRILVDGGTAVGVECRIATSPFRSRRARFFAPRIILCAGSLATPQILRRSGLDEAVCDGYYFDPSIALIGRVPGLQGANSFAATMGATLDDGIQLLDANLHRLFFAMGMLQTLRPHRIATYRQHVSIMVKAHDRVGGGLSEEGRYHKDIDAEAMSKLQQGVQTARRVLERAGAKGIITTPLMTGGAFGTLRLGKDVDADLQTRITGLHVCDGSLMPEGARVAPTLTLVCLAKYLARRLLSSQPLSRAMHPEPISSEAMA